MCCAVCERYKASDPSPAAERSPENSIKAMMEVLRQPPRDWPEDWPHWGTTLERTASWRPSTRNRSRRIPRGATGGAAS